MTYTVPTTSQRTKINKLTSALPWDYQVSVSGVDGMATIEMFLPGRRVRRITMGKLGGIKSDTTFSMD